ncbi:MAG TPA: hypothetical protein VL527_00645 [Dongiaceae bacterium]|nr:hypothetical protein [Dongiaceae bacterium]
MPVTTRMGRADCDNKVKMKKFSLPLKFAGVGALANLAAFWLCFAMLTAFTHHLTLWQCLGLAPISPIIKAGETGLIMAVGFLGAPAALLLDGSGGGHVILLLVLYSLLNAAIWGVGSGLLSAMIRRLAQNRKPLLTGPES